MSTADMNELEWPGERVSTARGLIDGPDGALEVAVEVPRESARGFVVICHPHPQQGGTLDNKVVYMTSRAAREAGYAGVRFNFRNTGKSEGRYDAGCGEQDDLRAVRDWAADASGLPPAGLAGFSFGSAVALRVAARDGTPSLITIGLPSEYFDGALPRPACDWLALVGDQDDVIDPQASIAAVRGLEPPPMVQVLEGAGHFLHGRLVELRGYVRAFWAGEMTSK